MSFSAANDPRELWTLLGTLGVIGGVLAWRVRREGRDPGHVVAHLADGTVIGAWRRGVRHRLPRAIDPSATARASRTPDPAVREDLEPGDLEFARIREAREGETGWFVEGLDSGPEPFRIRWRFETPDDAMAAFRLIQERILDAPVDADGRPLSLGDRDFDARWAAAESASRSAPIG